MRGGGLDYFRSLKQEIEARKAEQAQRDMQLLRDTNSHSAKKEPHRGFHIPSEYYLYQSSVKKRREDHSADDVRRVVHSPSSSSSSSSSQESSSSEQRRNNEERTEDELETHSEDNDHACMKCQSRRSSGERKKKRERRRGKLKQDKFGRYHIRFKDTRAKQVYHIEAPNNVFFNDNLSVAQVAATQ